MADADFNPYTAPSASVEPPPSMAKWGVVPFVPGGSRAAAAIGFLYAMAVLEVLSAGARW